MTKSFMDLRWTVKVENLRVLFLRKILYMGVYIQNYLFKDYPMDMSSDSWFKVPSCVSWHQWILLLCHWPACKTSWYTWYKDCWLARLPQALLPKGFPKTTTSRLPQVKVPASALVGIHEASTSWRLSERSFVNQGCAGATPSACSLLVEVPPGSTEACYVYFLMCFFFFPLLIPPTDWCQLMSPQYTSTHTCFIWEPESWQITRLRTLIWFFKCSYSNK